MEKGCGDESVTGGCVCGGGMEAHYWLGAGRTQCNPAVGSLSIQMLPDVSPVQEQKDVRERVRMLLAPLSKEGLCVTLAGNARNQTFRTATLGSVVASIFATMCAFLGQTYGCCPPEISTGASARAKANCVR